MFALEENVDAQIADNLYNVMDRIRAAAQRSGRTPDSVRLVAVTKGRSVSEIEAALAAGVTDIGENRVQEAQQKYEEVRAATSVIGCRWHLIGHLQRNKVKSALGMFGLIHSVESVRLLAEIARRSEARGQKTDVLIQVNTTGEATKHGLSSECLFDFMEKSLAYPAVRIVGLMTMGRLSESAADNRPAFALLRTLAEQVKAEQFPGITLPYLSMGMTNDFEVAIEEGANVVRIGRAIFGKGKND